MPAARSGDSARAALAGGYHGDCLVAACIVVATIGIMFAILRPRISPMVLYRDLAKEAG